MRNPERVLGIAGRMRTQTNRVCGLFPTGLSLWTCQGSGHGTLILADVPCVHRDRFADTTRDARRLKDTYLQFAALNPRSHSLTRSFCLAPRGTAAGLVFNFQCFDQK